MPTQVLTSVYSGREHVTRTRTIIDVWTCRPAVQIAFHPSQKLPDASYHLTPAKPKYSLLCTGGNVLIFVYCTTIGRKRSIGGNALLHSTPGIVSRLQNEGRAALSVYNPNNKPIPASFRNLR